MLNIYFGKKNGFKNTDEFIKRCYEKEHSKETRVMRSGEGRPMVESGYVSVTHTGNLIAVCFFDSPIGIDMENANRDDIDSSDALKVAERYFEEPMIDSIRKSGKEKFLEIWTQKEALLKKRGVGLAGGLKQTLCEYEHMKTIKYSMFETDVVLSIVIDKEALNENCSVNLLQEINFLEQ